jgi:hypothetical protein
VRSLWAFTISAHSDIGYTRQATFRQVLQLHQMQGCSWRDRSETRSILQVLSTQLIARKHALNRAFLYRKCFLVLAAAKFRKCIQPPLETFPPLPPSTSGVEPPRPERIALLAYSGGIGSATLLDLFHHNYYGTGKAKGGSKRKDIWKKARVCYVETCGAFSEVSFPAIHVLFLYPSYL